jgi:F-type H+-transporting ATPase subunit delta
MIPGALARRYARALLELASEKRIEDKVLGELEAFAQAYHDSDELQGIFVGRRVPSAVRAKVLDGLNSRIMASELTKKFLGLLDRKGRIVGVEDIYRSYKKMVDVKLGRVDAEVISPQALGMAESGQLKQQLEKMTGKKIVLTQTVDPSMVGGVITRVGHLVYDGSVKSFLEGARNSLMNEQ